MNKERLLELADVIEKLPSAAFDMEEWIVANEKAPCGTTACIAGHALMHFRKMSMANIRDTINGISSAASEVLGLSHLEAETLFYKSSWDEDWYEKYHGCFSGETNMTKNEVAAEYIREFVRTDGFKGAKW